MTGDGVPLTPVRIVGGHTRIGGGASVQLGATCRINVDHALDGVSADTMAAWLEANRRFFSHEQVIQLAGDLASGHAARGVLGAVGLILGAGDYERYQSAQDVSLDVHSREQAGFVESLHALVNRRMRLASEVELYGTSMKPCVAAVFARIVQIHFADGSSLNFVDLSEPVAADTAGDTSGVRAKKSERLRILPDE